MIASKIVFRLVQIVILILIIIYFNLFVFGYVNGQRLQQGADTTTVSPNGHRSGTRQDQSPNFALGAVFDQHSVEVHEAFKFAMKQYSDSRNQTNPEFQLFVDVIHTADVYKLSRLICGQFSRGVVSMLGAIPPDSFDTLHSFTNTFQVPFVTPWFPERVLPTTSGLIDYAVGLRPDYHRAVMETIIYFGWKHIIYIYDSHDGLLRLQQLYQSQVPGKAMFQFTYVKRVTNATEVINFLVSIEQMNRWSNKYVVLDCDTQLAKETLVLHVREVKLGRRNYQYFLTGLVMDNLSDKGVRELGAINVTGFSVLDHSRIFVKKFVESWHRDTISAPAALMYDTMQVIIDSMKRLQHRRPNLMRARLRANISHFANCNLNGKQLVPYEFGEIMSRIIRRTVTEGLTGHIQFTETGHRQNFTLQVMEMTVTGETVKVGTWYDNKGYVSVKEKLPGLRELGFYDRKKTYVVSTIAEYPYVIKDNTSDKLDAPTITGFCVDLTRLILDKMEITKYKIRLVKDGKYGSETAKKIGGWDGLVGELVRQEADLVVAPLTVNPERLEVIDFGKPYLTFDTKPRKAESSDIYTMFSFLIPLSMETWLCIVGGMAGVSLCLYIVGRYSPREGRHTSFTEPAANDDNDIVATRFTAVTEFNLWNSIWFSLGTFLQQGSNIYPRSLSGRIVSAVWCFFALIVIATYTATMASNLTVDRISKPLQAYTKITKCPQDKMTQLPIRGEDGDHPWTGSFDNMDGACELLISVTQSGVKEFAVAFPKGSKLRDGVDLALQALRDEGELQRLIRVWFVETKCATDHGAEGKELSLSQMAGLFYVLVGGLTLALLMTLLECCVQRRNVRRAQKEAHLEMERADGCASNTDCTLQHRELQDDHERLEWNRGAYSGYYATEGQSCSGVQQQSGLGRSFAHV